MIRTKTPDQIVADNVLRLRGDTSRNRLASLLSSIDGREWSAWRVMDIERKRKSRPSPPSASWTELISLALALDVSVFELVLPADPSTRLEMVTVEASFGVDTADGTPANYATTVERSADWFAMALFRLPRAPAEGWLIDTEGEGSFILEGIRIAAEREATLASTRRVGAMWNEILTMDDERFKLIQEIVGLRMKKDETKDE